MTDFDNINAGGVTQVGAYTPDKLYDCDTETRKRVISAGEGVLPRGALLGKVTATGEYRLSVAANNDGSEVPDAILLEPVNAVADTEAAIAIAGKFNPGAVTFGAGHTAASTEAVLRTKDIYFRTVIG